MGGSVCIYIIGPKWTASTVRNTQCGHDHNKRARITHGECEKYDQQKSDLRTNVHELIIYTGQPEAKVFVNKPEELYDT